MTDLDFYVDALLSGLVCGVGPGSTSDEVERALGRQFVDDARRHWMRRDYGLVELYFNRVEKNWICFGFTVQVHRMSDVGVEIVPSVLVDRYGAFATSLEIEVLVDAVSAEGGRNLVRESVAAEFVRYRLDGTNSFVHALHVQSKEPDARAGLEKVWSIEIGKTSSR
jgi:hypothetical protein